jgi:hypothetical protein
MIIISIKFGLNIFAPLIISSLFKIFDIYQDFVQDIQNTQDFKLRFFLFWKQDGKSKPIDLHWVYKPTIILQSQVHQFLKSNNPNLNTKV